MKVLGINGSPHENGNTAYAQRHALSLLEKADIETAYIGLADKTINSCDGCFTCRGRKCIYDDDMQSILEAIRQCDCLLLASPVYMGLVSGQMKTMMDRTVLFRVGGKFELAGKIGAGIACGGFRNGGQELTLQCMHTFFLQQDMFAIADGPRFSHSGATIVGNAAGGADGATVPVGMCEPPKAATSRRPTYSAVWRRTGLGYPRGRS